VTPWSGGWVSERATCVLAPNPSPMTLDGTNTYVLAEPGANLAVVVDPGPDDPDHLARVAATAEAGGRTVGLVLLTHSHLDHSGGARALAERVGAPLVVVDEQRKHLQTLGLGGAVRGTPEPAQLAHRRLVIGVIA